MIIFPELIDENLQISQVNVANEITITLRPTLPTAACPCCGTISKRVQSRYRRTLHDLPISGRFVRLIVEVRRFFCKKSTCARKIFAEQLPVLCRPHAQRTKRLQETLCLLGLAVGGQAGEDIGCEQGMSGSRDTILRLVRKFELPAAQEPRVIGLDDCAWKRRRRYGTLICDLEQCRPIDLLPDRRVETVSAWLQAHPHIDIVSRDGSSEYASAIKKGAPQARQVSDLWHLVKNLAACVSVQLAQSLAQIRRAEQAKAKASTEEKYLSEEQLPARTRAVQQAQHARQAERIARYEQMMMLQEQGMKSADLAAFAMASRVSHWITTGKRTESKRLQRLTTSDVSLPGNIGIISLQARFFSSHERDSHATQSALGSLSTTDDLALFPQARRVEGRRAGESPTVEAGKPTY